MIWKRPKDPREILSRIPEGPAKETGRLLVESDQWDNDEFRLWHSCGLILWIANKDYGLITYRGERSPNSTTQFDMTPIERQELWKLCKYRIGMCRRYRDEASRIQQHKQREEALKMLKDVAQ